MALDATTPLAGCDWRVTVRTPGCSALRTDVQAGRTDDAPTLTHLRSIGRVKRRLTRCTVEFERLSSCGCVSSGRGASAGTVVNREFEATDIM